MLERKFELSFATSKRRLIVSGMQVLYTNSRLLVSRENLYFGLRIISQTCEPGASSDWAYILKSKCPAEVHSRSFIIHSLYQRHC